MKPDGDASFVDSNILIFANSEDSPYQDKARSRLVELASAGVGLWVSRQVLREYAAVLSRNKTPATAIVADIERFVARFAIAEDGPAVTARFLDLLRKVPVGGKQVHDANIVATMLANGIRRLLTHNVADFARFSRYIDILTL